MQVFIQKNNNIKTTVEGRTITMRVYGNIRAYHAGAYRALCGRL